MLARSLSPREARQRTRSDVTRERAKACGLPRAGFPSIPTLFSTAVLFFLETYPDLERLEPKLLVMKLAIHADQKRKRKRNIGESAIEVWRRIAPFYSEDEEVETKPRDFLISNATLKLLALHVLLGNFQKLRLMPKSQGPQICVKTFKLPQKRTVQRRRNGNSRRRACSPSPSSTI